MNELKHTPGPWDFCKPGKEWLIYPEAARNDGIDYFIARIVIDQFPEAQMKADARLMAAAPELLEALQRIADAPNGSRTHADIGILAVMVAKEAIAKATRS